MARYLALDWDYQQLHVVAANVGGGAVRVQRAAVWGDARDPTVANAEAQGQQLKQRLREAGIAPGPTLIVVGRDRLILKEVRYPAVAPAEEPALVRFQTIKELSDSPEEVVIDYAPMTNAAAGGEQRALVLVIRRDLLRAYQQMCRAAGLTVAAVVPRPFGSAAGARRVLGTTVLTPAPAAADAPVAVLTVADQWADFCVARGPTLLFTRSMSTGGGLAGEIKRTVAVYNSQAPQPVQALYVASSGEASALRERLQELLGVPVHPLDPFAGADRAELPAGPRGSFLGAVGLLHLQADKRPLPLNFLKPREPKPAADPNRRVALVVGAVAAVLLLAVGGYCYSQLSAREGDLERLALQKANLARELVVVDEDAKRVKALADWEDHQVVWLDELYDMTHRFPDINSLRLTQLRADPKARTAKDPHVAKLVLEGLAVDRRLLDDLVTQMEKDAHYRWETNTVAPNTRLERRQFGQQFTTQLHVQKQPPDKYTRRLPPPKAVPKKEDEAAGQPPVLGEAQP